MAGRCLSLTASLTLDLRSGCCEEGLEPGSPGGLGMARRAGAQAASQHGPAESAAEPTRVSARSQ